MQAKRFYDTTMRYRIYIWRFALLTGQILAVTWHEFKQPVHTRCKCMRVVKRASQIIFRCFREANRNLYGVFTTCRASLNLLETAAKQTTQALATITVICLCQTGASHRFSYRALN